MSSWDRWGSTIGTRQQSVTVFTRGEGGGDVRHFMAIFSLIISTNNEVIVNRFLEVLGSEFT